MESVLREEIEALVKEVVEKHVGAAILEFVRKNEERAKELSLVERVVRVEEELKALREIEGARFQALEERFSALQREMDRRFEMVDKRFEALQREIDVRFTALDKRLTQVQWLIGIGIGLITILIGLLRFGVGISV